MRLNTAALVILFMSQNTYADPLNSTPGNPGAPTAPSTNQGKALIHMIWDTLIGNDQPFSINSNQVQPAQVQSGPAAATQMARQARSSRQIISPVDQYINGLFGEPKDFSSIRADSITYSGDTFFLKRGGLNQESTPYQIKQAKLKMPNGNPIQGSIIAFSKRYIYTQPTPEMIMQWDVSEGAKVSQRIIAFDRPVVGFSIYGDNMHIIIQNRGYVSLDENAHSNVTQNNNPQLISMALADNGFLPGGVEMLPAAITTIGNKMVSKISLADGKIENFSLTELMNSVGNLEKLTQTQNTSSNISSAQWAASGPNAIKVSNQEPSDIKIGRFLGVQLNHAVFFPEKGKMPGDPLIILRLAPGNKLNKVQAIYGVENATAFFLDVNILHLFINGQDITYDLTGLTPQIMEGHVVAIETNGRTIRSAKRLGSEMLTFGDSGLIASYPIPQRILTARKSCAEKLSALKLERGKLETQIQILEENMKTYEKAINPRASHPTNGMN